ncbi:MAG: polysaccharide pyruvyl transferase family protein, partial [Myxococcota bacterium]
MTHAEEPRRRTMVIGLPPDYRYPGTLAAWYSDTTRYAANLGACLITNALLRQLDADYVERFDDAAELRARYDTCVLALATHLHPSRDIGWIADVVERLDLKTIVLSAGIPDYDAELASDFRLHSSVRRVLEIASSGSNWLGVRGHYSAMALRRAGFANVVPIGCPTLYWGLRENLEIHTKASCENPIVTYHLTLGRALGSALGGLPLLGQDFQDHAAFTDDLAADRELQNWLRSQFADEETFATVQSIARANGTFLRTFDDWFTYVGRHDFVTGPRLHGCIAGLVQGIPAVMAPRDLRVRELVEFYGLPTTSYEALGRGNLAAIYRAADFSRFTDLYPRRYRSFVAFLRENGVPSRHSCEGRPELVFESEDLANAARVVESSGRSEVRTKTTEARQQIGEIWRAPVTAAASAARRILERARRPN